MEKIIRSTGFIQLKRNEEVLNLIKKRPSAFLLLTLIAFRARRTKENKFDGLEIGEAYIGDFESYGVTEQIYRTDKKFLELNGIITTKPTNKGTIARLTHTTFFDINADTKYDTKYDTNADELTTKITNDQRTANEQPTTNNNDNNVKNANNTNNVSQIEINKEKSFPYKEETQKQTPTVSSTRGIESMREVLKKRGIIPKGVKQNGG